ncbi:Tat proofreading chaperone DmsD [compost metagenome]
MPQNEPEDHFGTMLMLAAWLSENGHEDACDQLLAWHLLPWSQRFLTVLRENARHPFYVGITELAQMTLVDWQSRLPIPVIEKTLYR